MSIPTSLSSKMLLLHELSYSPEKSYSITKLYYTSEYVVLYTIDMWPHQYGHTRRCSCNQLVVYMAQTSNNTHFTSKLLLYNTLRWTMSEWTSANEYYICNCLLNRIKYWKSAHTNTQLYNYFRKRPLYQRPRYDVVPILHHVTSVALTVVRTHMSNATHINLFWFLHITQCEESNHFTDNITICCEFWDNGMICNFLNIHVY